LPPHHLLRQTQYSANFSHFVFEKLPQWLNQPELHPLGQSPHIVVTLDQGSRIARNRHTLDHIRIQRPLSQKLGSTPHLLRCFIKNVNEFPSDDLPFLLRIGHPTESAQKSLSGIDHRQVEVPVFSKNAFYAFHLPLTQQPIIDKNTSKLVSDRAMQERRRHTRIHPAA
jgi:hypothetical protein